MKYQKHFKENHKYLYWRQDELTSKELLTNIIQMEDKKALKDFIKFFWFEKTHKLFLELFDHFDTIFPIKKRYLRMVNWFILYWKKQTWEIKDMRKYRYWYTIKD